MAGSQQHETQSAEQASSAATAAGGDQGRVEIRLPFLTITRGGHPARGETPAGQTTSGGRSAGLEQLAFYGGAAALAAFGVIDWPVAALVAAGTYIASKSRGRSGDRPEPQTGASAGGHDEGEEQPRQPGRRARTNPRGSRS
jgi:hypothetical protein